MVAKLLTAKEAVGVIKDGDTVALSGFGLAGQPLALINELINHGAKNLTIIANNAGNGDSGLAKLLATKAVRKIVCSFPRQKDSFIFDELYRNGEIELELVAQGTLAEQIRAQGAGIGGFYTRTAVGTQLAAGKELKVINGQEYVLEFPANIDVALVHGHIADTQGNVNYWKTARNFGPIMAAAARHSIVEVSRIVEIGSLDPESIVTPSIYVNSLVVVGAPNE